MRNLVHSLWLGAAVSGCVPPYLDTAAPKDATFALACELPASDSTAGQLRVDVAFADVGRHYAFGCEHRAAMLARLQTIADLWCDGLAVGPQQVGGLLVSTTSSERSGKRAATIDDGDGYVAFQCDGWLPELIAQLERTTCCNLEGAAVPSPETAPGGKRVPDQETSAVPGP